MAKQDSPPTEEALIKEVCRLIRVALLYWDAHNNAACRGERALALYNTLSKKQKERIPQVLWVWLRYRSEKYFGTHRTPPKSARKPCRAPTKPYLSEAMLDLTKIKSMHLSQEGARSQPPVRGSTLLISTRLKN